jgi:signal transduction histidine kinase/CheY-like chemotaxis protein
VLDLTEDCRFNTLDFVTGPPYFRNYAGVPLCTSKGIKIGSLYILNSRLRPALTNSEKQFLGVMANNVMQHIEMSRDKKDRQRTFKMNECLSTYVDPATQSAKYTRRYNSQNDSTGAMPEVKSLDESGRFKVIIRAAESLREAMDLEEDGGGVIFVDTLAAVRPQKPCPGDDCNSEVTSAERPEGDEKEKPVQKYKETTPGMTSTSNIQLSSRKSPGPHTSVTEILAHTYQPTVALLDRREFIPFTPKELSKFIKHYPRGKLFTLDSLGQEVSSSSEDESALAERPKSSRRHRATGSKLEVENVRAHFPNARQIIFLPLWDLTTSRSIACFVYNCSDYRNFSHHLEFLHCITFNNCIETELGRLANLRANEQKSDFIGLISHEFRSPLHGILASCEFLQDTTCTSFQQSLVNTANSCARTLLDIVNMVLDHSKINAFERNSTQASGLSQEDMTTNHTETLQIDLSTYCHVNLAILTEEVVEGVAAGHAFNDPLNCVGVYDTIDAGSSQPGLASSKADVKLIITIPKQDWVYWTEPGALRRIIMNLVGNSLKYTTAGYVHVELATQDIRSSSASDAATSVVLTVTDSGQGMSPAYLKDKLFTPFTQESNLAPGMGLGLSLVKSIVSTHGGNIDVESTPGIGTKVTVKLPMTKGTQTGPGGKSKRSMSSERGELDGRGLIMSQESGSTAAVHWHEREEATKGQPTASNLMLKSLTVLLSTWYGISVSQWRNDSTVDIVITGEVGLNALIRDSPQLFALGCRTMVLVLSNTASMQSLETALANHNNIERIRHPLGPYKLGRAIQACLERLSPTKRPHSSGVEITRKSVNVVSGQSLLEETTVTTRQVCVSDKPQGLEKVPITELDDSCSCGSQFNVQKAIHRIGCVRGDAGIHANADSQFTCEAHPELLIENIRLSEPHSTPLTITRSTLSPARLANCIDQAEVASYIAKPEPGCSALDHKIITNPDVSTRSPRVLLVDDNMINLRLLQVGMKKRGYTAINNAENGLQAVNTYRDLLYGSPSEPPDIVLMDLSMPIMDGFEATRQIREMELEYNSQLSSEQQTQTSLIIALTGLASVRDQKEAFTCGVDTYMMKPVKFAKLTQLLEDWATMGKTMPSREVSNGLDATG